MAEPVERFRAAAARQLGVDTPQARQFARAIHEATDGGLHDDHLIVWRAPATQTWQGVWVADAALGGWINDLVELRAQFALFTVAQLLGRRTA